MARYNNLPQLFDTRHLQLVLYDPKCNASRWVPKYLILCAADVHDYYVMQIKKHYMDVG